MGEACGELIFPTLFVPDSTACIDEGFELGGESTHVGGGTEDDGVCAIEVGDGFVVFPATFAEIRVFDSQQNGVGLRHGSGTFGDRQRELLRVSGSGKVDDRDVFHGISEFLGTVVARDWRKLGCCLH